MLTQVRRSIRLRHYSRRTEQAYVRWVRRLVRFHGDRHPSELGRVEVTEFLSSLAVRGRVSASTQDRALCALVFLYREVSGEPCGWLDSLVRAKRPSRLPVVLSQDEVRAVLGQLEIPRLVAGLLYGSGIRLLECLSLRVKDVEFGFNRFVIRDGKGGNSRVTVLPQILRSDLRRHLGKVERLYWHDVADPRWSVAVPGALKRKYLGGGREWVWQWVFPATRTYVDACS
jgi:integrase